MTWTQALFTKNLGITELTMELTKEKQNKQEKAEVANQG